MLFKHHSADYLAGKLESMPVTSTLDLHPIVVPEMRGEPIFIRSHIYFLWEISAQQLRDQESVGAVSARPKQ
jgi:hypothetical protein